MILDKVYFITMQCLKERTIYYVDQSVTSHRNAQKYKSYRRCQDILKIMTEDTNYKQTSNKS